MWAGAAAVAVLVAGVLLSWEYFRFWWRFESLGKNAQGYREYKHKETGIVFVRVPGGKFLMGAQNTDPSAPNYDPDASYYEGPVHAVILSPFLMAKYEVSRVEWRKTIGSDPFGAGGDARVPQGEVTWDGCKEFCTRTGFVLPTEAQWEHACRLGTAGPDIGREALDEVAWHAKNSGSGGGVHPIGKKKANGLGLHDLQGNMWEWCEDFLDVEFYSKPEARRSDPVATSGYEYRVVRGGSWRVSA